MRINRRHFFSLSGYTFLFSKYPFLASCNANNNKILILIELARCMQNTIIMTYSEFDRKAKENGSRGTDHGMSAPHFLIGGKINGGIIGEYEDLSNLWNNNINYNIDYRSLYE